MPWKWPTLPNPWRTMMTADLPHLKFWALLGAAVMMTIGSGILVWIVYRGGWPVTLREKQLDILGMSLFLLLAGILVVVVTLASARLTAQGPGNFRVEVDSDDSPPGPVISASSNSDGSVQVQATPGASIPPSP